jgi:small-conductance mechanosensitive channel
LTAAPAQPEAATTNDAFYAQVENFFSGLLTLDPQQAALRAGLSFLVLMIVVVVLALLHKAMTALAGRVAPDEGATKKRFKLDAWTVAIVRLTLAVAALLAIANIWGLDLEALLRGPFGVVLLAIGRIALTIVVMLVAIELAQLAISRTFDRVASRARNPRRAAQLRTLSPVISGVVTTVLFIIAAMMVLSNIGIEIGPLLAGAGIAGVAIGFGAQTLVKDFLTGMFLIIEDTVSIGDVVSIADFGGVVEDMSLRTIKLRDFDGTLHVIPYGEAQTIHNKTKGFSYSVIELTIAYSSDIGRALEVMKETGDEFRKDDAFAATILDNIEVVGVEKLAEAGVILKARIKTLPGKQWALRREYLKRIKIAFDGNDIELPTGALKLAMMDAPLPVIDQTRAAK